MSTQHGDPLSSSTTLELHLPPWTGAWFVEVQDEAGGRRAILADDRLVVGSSTSADIRVHDSTVSGHHCALAVLGSGVAIEDLGSTNGTFVGGARIREAWGGAGATVSIGRSMLVLVPADERETLEEPGDPLPGVAGGSMAMRRVAEQVRRLARHSLPVLVAGESGTGKELVARALHSEGPRARHAFVAINVTALPRELVESELFGHERGAFTGARARRAGAFVEAAGGTLFLDEIGDLPLDAQPKLLRALDGYEVRRIGSDGAGVRADTRVVAATHAPLERRVVDGSFRRDLFHRLECFVVNVPPLRERRGDIPAIVRELLRQLASHVGRRAISPAALARLAAYDWPGNVRELRNVLCRAADATSPDASIEPEDVVRAMRPRGGSLPPSLTADAARALLREHGGNLSAAARAARVPRTTYRKLLRRG